MASVNCQRNERMPLLVCGTINQNLARRISNRLGWELRIPQFRRFADGECCPQVILDDGDTIRGRQVFIIQPTCRSFQYSGTMDNLNIETRSVNDAVMELCILTDAIKRSGPREIILVVPYYGYARQDKKYLREPITSKLVADFKSISGANGIIFMDLHSSQTMMAFHRNLQNDNLYSEPYHIQYIREHIIETNDGYDIVIVSPDEGGTKRAKRVAEKLEVDFAVCDKTRSFIETNKVETMTLKGDVTDKIAIIVDDMIDTAGTACKAAEILKQEGASKIYMLACHGVFSQPAIKRIHESAFEEVIVTNTMPPHPDLRFTDKISIIDISPIFAEAISRWSTCNSITELQHNGTFTDHIEKLSIQDLMDNISISIQSPEFYNPVTNKMFMEKIEKFRPPITFEQGFNRMLCDANVNWNSNFYNNSSSSITFFNLLGQYFSFALSDTKQFDLLMTIGSANLALGYAMRPFIGNGNPFMLNIPTPELLSDNYISSVVNSMSASDLNTVVIFTHMLTEEIEKIFDALFVEYNVKNLIYLSVYKVCQYSGNYYYTDDEGRKKMIQIKRHSLDTIKI